MILCERIKYWESQETGGGKQTLHIYHIWLDSWFFFKAVPPFIAAVFSDRWGDGVLEDMLQLQQRGMGKMGNKGIKATEEIMEKAGTSCKAKQKVKLQGGTYLPCFRWFRIAFEFRGGCVSLCGFLLFLKVSHNHRISVSLHLKQHFGTFLLPLEIFTSLLLLQQRRCSLPH